MDREMAQLGLEAAFVDVIGEKILEFFSLLLTETTSNGFYSPSPLSKSGLKLVCNDKLHVCELSRLCSETSTKLYVHELGFWKAMIVAGLFSSDSESEPFWAGSSYVYLGWNKRE
jgi:hypothetical protein